MVDWLVVWGIGQAGWSVFRPILEDLAKEATKDAAKSYVGECFKKVFSVIHREPLTKATGLALKELLALIEGELIRADIDEAELRDWIGDVRRFVGHDDVRQAIASLFLDPDYHLDPKTFVTAWQQLEGAHTLPAEFSWQFVAKRFAVKVAELRQSSSELRETFASLARVRDSTALKELAGLPPDFNLDAYREALVERYGNLKFDMLDTTGAYYSGVRLWSVFVPQSVRECHEYTPQLLEIPKEHLQRLVEKGELAAAELAEAERLQDERRRQYVSQPLRPVLEVVSQTRETIGPVLVRTIPRIVILGDPGSGKSSLLQFLALRWARIEDANLRYTQPLPLLIELREYNRWPCPDGKSFPQYLHKAPTWHRLNQQTLDYLLKQPGRVVLLLDGLDEVFDPAQRQHVLNDIHRFSNEYPGTRIVVTSRVFGYQAQRLRDAEFRHFMLQDLDEKQIGGFLDKWHEVTFDDQAEAAAKEQRLRTAIRNSKSIAQLAGNPLLLTMMAILNRHQELPRDRADLYQQCARLLLHQWDVERTLGEFPGLSAEIGLREKTDILRSVAYAMQSRLTDKSRANYIDGTTLTSLIEDYLHTELRFEQPRAVARALVEHLRTRNFILCYLGADSYAFVHRTFLEYFCAADIVHQFNVAQTLSEPDLIALFDAHCRDDDWREVLRLICGQIDDQFVGRIVEHLATRTDLEKWDGETPLPEFPLAIWCLVESRTPTKLVRSGDRLLSSIRAAFSKMPNREGHWATTREPADDIYRTFGDELIKASKELGPNWPTTIDQQLIPSDLKAAFNSGLWLWSQLLGMIARDRDVVCLFVQQETQAIQAGGLRAMTYRWPDNETRLQLESYVESGMYDGNRVIALQLLAETWTDEASRASVTQHALDDPDEWLRYAAIHILAEKWADGTTRTLLITRVAEDKDFWCQTAAVEALATKWPDETTRALLAGWTVDAPDSDVRRAALQALAEKWPVETTRELLTQRAVQAPDETRRGEACSALGKIHSEFGRILPTRDLDGTGPYLDPLQPIPREHIERAAKRCGIPADEIDAHVASLSAHLGWGVTRGASPAAPQPKKKKPRG